MQKYSNSNFKQQAEDILKKVQDASALAFDAVKSNAPMIAMGAIPLATAGGISQASGGIRPGETESQYRTRILRASLLGGLVGGSALPLGNYALENFLSANPVSSPEVLKELNFENSADRTLLEGDQSAGRANRLGAGFGLGTTAGLVGMAARDRSITTKIDEASKLITDPLFQRISELKSDWQKTMNEAGTRLGKKQPKGGFNAGSFSPKEKVIINGMAVNFSDAKKEFDTKTALNQTRLDKELQRLSKVKAPGVGSVFKKRFSKGFALDTIIKLLLASGAGAEAGNLALQKGLPLPDDQLWGGMGPLNDWLQGIDGDTPATVRVKK